MAIIEIKAVAEEFIGHGLKDKKRSVKRYSIGIYAVAFWEWAGMREILELGLAGECASGGGDKIGYAHLVRSRGVAAFEQPIASQSFGYFVIGPPLK